MIIGDLNVNWLDETERSSLYNVMINEKVLEQLIVSFTTDNELITCVRI